MKNLQNTRNATLANKVLMILDTINWLQLTQLSFRSLEQIYQHGQKEEELRSLVDHGNDHPLAVVIQTLHHQLKTAINFLNKH